MAAHSIPQFDDLPPVEGMPKGCAWGIFDKDGIKDVYGTLNLLTPDVVRAAGAEVRDGVSISLNWPLNSLSKIPMPGRKPPVHKVHSIQSAGLSPGLGWDDEIDFNTQCSSQWDSLVHWQHQASGLAYNGAKPTDEALAAKSTADNTMPTLDHWHARGGVVARGVLVDFAKFAKDTGVDFHPFAGYRITVEELEKAARHQGVEFRRGDVLLVRTGFTDVWSNPSEADMAMLMKGQMSGVHGSEETVRWLWDRGFAAIASDNMAVEALPPVKADGSVGGYHELVIHEYALSLFGMPLGELWDLGRLSEYCAKTGRYTFMLTSVPLNTACLVGSPPNALAIF